MESNYDEDLNDNSFFRLLQSDHLELFERALTEGWIICVPRSGSLPKYVLTDDSFFSHILLPSDELPESHFRTLNNKEVRICNRVITVEDDYISRPYSTHILFEETFYTEDLHKYKILCIENPLEIKSGTECVDTTRVIVIQTLRDCIDLLWTESVGKEVLEQMDEAILSFLATNKNLEFELLQVQKDLASGLYIQCLQIALKDTRLRNKTSSDKHLLDNVKLSVETYVHHGIYKKLMKGVTACTAYDDARLNKIVRNLSDLQLRDLDIRLDLYDTVPRAKQELARVDGYSTILGKIGCLKRMVAAISKQNGSMSNVEISGGNVAADDLLPMIIFLVIKTGLPNWISHLTYLKQFHFSSCSTFQVDEHSFLITSLEAAIEHIKSGILHGPSAPESQFDYECHPVDEGPLGMKSWIDDSGEKPLSPCITHFFDQVRLGNIDKVIDLLGKNTSVENNNLKNTEINNSSLKKDYDIVAHLCHPLCSCDKCESLISKSRCDTTPTVYSCDDRGFTALHVACMFGHPLIVDSLICYGSKVDTSDYSGSTPLHYAAGKGHQNALLLLIHSGAKVNIADNDGNTPLHLASNNGHEDCVKALLYFAEHIGMELDTSAANSHGDTPLHHAARWGYEGIIHILLEYGAHPDIDNKRRLTPMDYAHSLHVSKLLISATKTIKFSGKHPIPNSQASKLSVKAVTKCTLDFSDDVVKAGTSVEPGKEQIGIRPLSTKQIKMVDKLLRAIAFGDIRLACYYIGLEGPTDDPDGFPSLPDIKCLCHPLCDCDKCQPISEGNIDNGYKADLDILNVNVCNSEGFTPLHVAAMHGRTEMVMVLLDAGAHANVRTWTKGATALHVACQNQRTQVAKLLLESRDCDVDIQDLSGNTALHYACYTGNARLVESILKYKPQLDIKNSSGKTAVGEAEEKMSLTVIRLLKGGKSMAALWQEDKIQ